MQWVPGELPKCTAQLRRTHVSTERTAAPAWRTWLSSTEGLLLPACLQSLQHTQMAFWQG